VTWAPAFAGVTSKVAKLNTAPRWIDSLARRILGTLERVTGGPSRKRAKERAVAKAAQLIADTGYHRRDPELAELKARLAAT
jgi:hypothetical protein